MARVPFPLAAVLFPLLALSASAAAAADRDTSGELLGSVRAPDGTPLPQLVLLLRGPAGAQRVVTGTEGRYRASNLPAGEYTLGLEAPGFTVDPAPRINVNGAPVRLDLTLSPAPLSEQVIVSATRGEAALSTLGITASVVDARAVAEREATTLLPLLDLPGLAVARTGGAGHQASVFVRGGESRYARVLVDGVPVNQPGGLHDFGNALPLELERIELVRGAASALYGTDALAGVLHLVTRRAGPASGGRAHAEAEGGSHGWWRAQAGTSGRRGGLDWNAGLQRLETDNQGPHGFFRQTSAALSLGLAGEGPLSARLTARLDDGEVATPGPAAFGRPDLDATFERADWVLGLALRRTGVQVVHELRAGLARTEQLSLNPADSGPFLPRWEGRTGPFAIPDFPDPLGFQNDTARLSLGYRVETQVGGHLLTAGADLERESGELGSRAGELIAPERTNFGGYVQDRVVLGERLHLTAGARVERNGSYGTRAVPRAAAAWRLRGGADATTLRASAGAGIKEPDFFQSFGASPFARGNPDLKPERSRTFDLGLEQRLLQGRLRAQATLFHHDYLDQIAYTVTDFETFEGSFINIGKARARGLELEVEAEPWRHVGIGAQYTLLDGEIVVSPSEFDPLYRRGQPLLRRPRHQGSLRLRVGGQRLGASATLLAVGRRADSDFVGLDLTENPGHQRLDARVRWRPVRRVEAFLAAENLLDERYQDVLGFPALGRSVRVGLRWRPRE